MEHEKQELIGKHQQEMDQEFKQHQVLIQDKQHLQNEISEMQTIINNMTNQNDQAQLHISKQQNEINKQANQLKLMKDIDAQRQEMEQQILHDQGQRDSLTLQIQKIQDEAAALRSEDEQFAKSLRDELVHIKQEREEFQKNCIDKDVKIKSLMQTNLDLQSQIGELNSIVASKDNLEKIIVAKMNYINEI